MTVSPSLTPYLTAKLQQTPVDPTLALIFPGQGSQVVGMGADLPRASQSARGVFEEAEIILGRDLSRLCFQGPEEELRQTANAQPAILVTSLACLIAALETGGLSRRPAFVAGHSLGEYTALVAAGCLSFEDALRMVSERGRLMQEAGASQPGAMAAVLGLTESEADEVCRLSGAEACNYNSPSQVVIGGPPSLVARASSLARERGARVLPLNVSAAFHTSLMGAAAADFARAVNKITICDPQIPVMGNVSARPLGSAAEVRDELERQIISPVLWRQSVVAMAEAGVNTLIEVGPGRVLSSLIKRSGLGLTLASIDGPASLASVSNV
jgi:[acyl-carrier-protein] S-malonyltransferase